MKKLYFLLVTMFVLNGAVAQWIQQISGTTRTLNSVFFTDANTGYVVGDSGTILTTSNGGSQWTVLNSGTTNNLRSVCFTTPLVGYAVGQFGTVLKTTNGGNAWTMQVSGTTSTLNSIDFATLDSGCAVGDHGTIINTADGGNNWSKFALFRGNQLNSICYADHEKGFAVGSHLRLNDEYGILISTTNSVIEWRHCLSMGSFHFNTIQFPNENVGYIGVEIVYPPWKNAFIIKISGNCYDWNIVGTANIAPASIFFTDTLTGYIVGIESNFVKGAIIKTTDGGVTWSTALYQGANELKAVFFVDSNTGYVVGQNGIILKTNNGGGFPVGINNRPSTPNTLNIYPNPASNNITIETITEGYLSIQSLNGQQFLQKEITQQRTSIIDISTLPSGVYLVKVTGVKGVQVGKFMKL